MPKPLTQEEKWELFFKTILKNCEIKVTAVNNQDVTFTADSQAIQYLRNLLTDPEELKLKIVHAINHNKKTPDYDIVSIISSQEITAIPEYYNDLPIDLLNKLLDPEYTANDIGLEKATSLTNFQYDEVQTVARLHLDGTKGSIQRDTGKFKMFMDSIPDVSTALKILHSEIKPVNEEFENTSGLSSKIFTITINNPPICADITYNHGLLLQTLQHAEGILPTSERPPIIALSNIDKIEEWILRKEVIVNYLAPIFNNIIFSSELETDEVRPIMFSSKKIMSAPHSLHVLFDTSQSMENDFQDYLKKYLYVLNKFIKAVPDWEITIVQFNHEINATTYNSKEHNFSEITNYVNKFQATGTTNLHGALCQSLTHYKSYLQDNLPSTLVVFTDGQHIPADKNLPDIPVKDIVELAQEVGRNSNFALYSMGLGKEYNQEFFTKIANDGGFTHINLNTTNDIDQLMSYMESCGNTRMLLEFINDTVKFTERVPQDGDIHVANSSIQVGGIVNFNGNTYTIGTTEDFDVNAIGENYYDTNVVG